MKKIAILGAGVSGLAAATYLLRLVEDFEIDIYSKDIGGSYTSGGLKYIHSNKFSNKFVRDFIGIDKFQIQKVIGSILVGGELELYPEYFHRHPKDGFLIQKGYWQKTRNTMTGFDTNSMNDPWSSGVDLKIMIDGGLENMIGHMKFLVENNCNLITDEINVKKLKEIIKDYDHVIYTIPISILLELSEQISKSIKYVVSKNKNLHIGIVEDLPNEISNSIWYDYIYIPSNNFNAHRFSKSFRGDFHLEVNDHNYHNGWLNEDLLELSNYLDIDLSCGKTKEVTIPIKGQIIETASVNLTEALEDLFPKVIRLGRYAEWNRRTTFDSVMKKILTTFPQKIG